MSKMNINRKASLCISIGLLLTTIPQLLREFIHIPDFFRGLSAGLGMGSMIGGLILMKKHQKAAASNTQK